MRSVPQSQRQSQRFGVEQSKIVQRKKRFPGYVIPLYLSRFKGNVNRRSIVLSDTPTLARFYSGWKHGGTAEDGMPLYFETIMIRLDRPPWLSVQREAEPSDFEEHSMAFQMFQKEQAARKVSLAEGYPLSMWPACNEAIFKMLADRDIYTVQQLAKSKKPDMPAELRELADRAAKLVELQSKAGKYEELLRDRDGRIKALEESLEEASKTIMGQKSIIDTLKAKAS